MTNAVALTGQWEGLRAVPRTLRTPDHRKRLEDGLERLGGLFEQMAFRAALLAAGMDRLNGLRASMIDQLDALDAPTEDMEPDADLEPSLCHPGAMGSDPVEDLEQDSEDEGAQCDDEGFDSDSEANLCGVTFGAPFGSHDGENERTADYGMDQRRPARVTDNEPPALPRTHHLTGLGLVGPALPVFQDGRWSLSTFNGTAWVSA